MFLPTSYLERPGHECILFIILVCCSPFKEHREIYMEISYSKCVIRPFCQLEGAILIIIVEEMIQLKFLQNSGNFQILCYFKAQQHPAVISTFCMWAVVAQLV